MGDTATLGNPFWPGNFPDPFVLKVRGRYYAYATEGDERPDRVREQPREDLAPAVALGQPPHGDPHDRPEEDGHRDRLGELHVGEAELVLEVGAERPEERPSVERRRERGERQRELLAVAGAAVVHRGRLPVVAYRRR